MPKPVNFRASYIAPNSTMRKQATVAPQAKLCSVQIKEVRDERDTGKTLSDNAWMHINDGDVTGWIRSGLKTMQSSSFDVTELVEDENKLVLSLQTTLRKAYLSTIATSKASTVVVSYEIADKNNTVKAQGNLRGSDTSINWNGTEQEVNESFNRSLTFVLQQLRDKLSASCHSYTKEAG